VNDRDEFNAGNIDYGELEGEEVNFCEKYHTDPTQKAEPGTWAAAKSKISSVEWAWPLWLPKGFITILAGRPGECKSAVALRLAGSFGSAQERLPDGHIYTGEPKKILWCETEASLSIHLQRARAWGYDLNDFVFPLDDSLADFSLDNPAHWKQLAEKAMRPGIGLIIIDSLRGAHSGEEKSSKVMTKLFKRLGRLTVKTGKPVIVTHHLRKLNQYDRECPGIDALRGSSVISGFARVVWFVDTPDPSQKERKRLSVIKNNLCKPPSPIGFTMTDQGIEFGDAPEAPKIETQRQRAKNLLIETLSRGPASSNGLKVLFENQKISWTTILRTKRELGIYDRKNPEDGYKTYWHLVGDNSGEAEPDNIPF